MSSISHNYEDIRQALNQYHSPDVLSITTLAQSPLVTQALWFPSEKATRFNLGIATQALIDWGLDKLAGKGTKTALANYEALDVRYRKQMSVSEYAREYDLFEQTIQKRRLVGTQKLAKIFQDELDNPFCLNERQKYILVKHYHALSQSKQQALQILSLIEKPLPLISMGSLLPNFDHEAYQHLKEVQLIRANDDDSLSIILEFKPHIINHIPIEHRIELSRLIAKQYQTDQQLIDAASYFLDAQDQPSAANAILSLSNNEIHQSLAQLHLVLDRFEEKYIDNNTWAELKFLSGQIYASVDDVLKSVTEYELALCTTDQVKKADIHSKLAYSHRSNGNYETSLIHTSYGIRLLEQESLSIQELQLLTKLYLFEALLYTSDLLLYEKAYQSLQQADWLVEDKHANDPNWIGARCDLSLHWGHYEHAMMNTEATINHYLQARIYALEANDLERRIKATHSLGLIYSHNRKDYAKALTYFYESLDLAKETGNHYIQAGLNCEIANSLREYKSYPEAIEYLTKAYEYLEKTHNDNIFALTIYGFLRVYLEWGNVHLGLNYYRQICEMSAQKPVAYITYIVNEVRDIYSFIDADINERQFQGLLYLQKKKVITRQEYVELNEVSKSTAQNELGELVKMEWCERHGRGRGVRYTLAAQYKTPKKE